VKTILKYITLEQFNAITEFNTTEEIASLIWCVEHQPEHLRRDYLMVFLGGPVTDELNDFFYSRGKYAKVQEVAHA
jgi:hypothetical protein